MEHGCTVRQLKEKLAGLHDDARILVSIPDCGKVGHNIDIECINE